jgi:ADP-heptose:LPS heptosyltransferase
MLTYKPKNIAVFCICGLGDIICTLPGLFALDQKFPDSKIVIITNEKAVVAFFSILRHRFEVINLSNWAQWSLFRKLRELINLTKGNYEIVLSRGQPTTYKVPLLVLSTMGKLKIGAAYEKLRFIYDELVPIDVTKTHSIDRFLKLASCVIGEEIKFTSWETLNLSFQGVDRILSEWPRKISLKYKRTVLVAPGGDLKMRGRWSPLLKRWPSESYKSLLGQLVERNMNVIIVGGSEDANIAAFVAAGRTPSDGVYNLSGQTSLSELIAIVKHSDVIIGHDSGIAHLSAMLSKRAIVLFGPTIPELFGPRGKTVYFMTGEGDCRGCFPEPTCCQSQCGVMKSIIPEHVFEILLKMEGSCV